VIQESELITLNEEKRNNHEVVGNNHTTEIRSNDIPKIPDNQKFFTSIWIDPQKRTGEVISKSKVNVSNFGEGEVLTYSHFMSVIDKIINIVQLSDFTFRRSDFKLDSFVINDYDNFFKLNKLIVMLFTCIFTIKVKDRAETTDLFTNDRYSIFIKNDDVEIQFYDKVRESEGKNPATSRLEFRKKRMETKDLSTIGDYWCKQLSKLSSHYEELQQKINNELIAVYWRDKNKYPVLFRSANEFIMQHQSSIFSHKQLTDLYQRMGYTSAAKRAKNYKYRYGLERFSKRDIDEIAKKYQTAVRFYFEN